MFGKQCKTAFEQLLATTHGFFGMAHVKAILVAPRAQHTCHLCPLSQPTLCSSHSSVLIRSANRACGVHFNKICHVFGAGASHAGRPACAVAQDVGECGGQDHRGIRYLSIRRSDADSPSLNGRLVACRCCVRCCFSLAKICRCFRTRTPSHRCLPITIPHHSVCVLVDVDAHNCRLHVLSPNPAGDVLGDDAVRPLPGESYASHPSHIVTPLRHQGQLLKLRTYENKKSVMHCFREIGNMIFMVRSRRGSPLCDDSRADECVK